MLDVLIGKTIESIEYFESDSYGNDEHVESHMALYFTDTTYAVISASDPNCKDWFYATLEIGKIDVEEEKVISGSIKRAGPKPDVERPWKYAGD